MKDVDEMIVIADTSPLRYLIELRVVDVLHDLFGEVTTTPTVIAELGRARAPAPVRAWASKPPSWLRIIRPATDQFAVVLDPGEASAISLALEMNADLLLVDERKATRIAREAGLLTAGTLGILRDAARAGKIDLRQTLAVLTSMTTFRHDEKIIRRVLDEFEQDQRRE